jgi:hypothetical protein
MDEEILKAAVIPGRLYVQMGRFVEAQKRVLDFQSRIRPDHEEFYKGIKTSYDFLHVIGAGGADAMSTIVGLEALIVTAGCAFGFLTEGKPAYALGFLIGAGLTAGVAAMRIAYYAIYKRQERKALEKGDSLQKQLLGYTP